MTSLLSTLKRRSDSGSCSSLFFDPCIRSCRSGGKSAFDPIIGCARALRSGAREVMWGKPAGTVAGETPTGGAALTITNRASDNETREHCRSKG